MLCTNHHTVCVTVHGCHMHCCVSGRGLSLKVRFITTQPFNNLNISLSGSDVQGGPTFLISRTINKSLLSETHVIKLVLY